MTTKIPDDVVERALAEFFDFEPSHYADQKECMCAAGDVFVAWEREQCGKILDDKARLVRSSIHCGSENSERHDARVAEFAFEEAASAIRARSAPEKS